MAFAQKLLNGLQEFMNEMREWIRLAVLPKGSIIMFHGSKIPTGWQICDGTNGTPDLRGRYPMGCKSGQATGTYIQAGLPNIKGRVGAIGEENTNYTTGAFYQDGTGAAGDREGWDYFVFMDASRSSKIYGNSNTVTPETISLYFIMKIVD